MIAPVVSSSVLPSQVIQPGITVTLFLLAAIIGGYAARLVRVPRVVGYLVAGVVLRYCLSATLAGSESAPVATEILNHSGRLVQGFKSLALGIILFTLGGVFERRHLKSVGGRIWRMSAAEIACVGAIVAAGCALAYAISNDRGAGQTLTFGLLLGIAAMATAPAATLLVLREYDAKGPISDAIMTLTAVNNTVSVVLFHSVVLILSAAGVIHVVHAGERLLWLDLVLISVGSVALGTLLGFVFSVLYSKRPLTEFLIVFFALLLGLGEGRAYLAESLHLSLSSLLTCLFFGAVFANITVDQEPLHKSLEMLAGPIYAGFFVLAGSELHVEEITALGLVGVAYVLLRTAGKALGGYLGARWARAPGEVRGYVGLGLVCQAGVAIGLADFLANTWGGYTAEGFVTAPEAQQFKTIILGSVVLFEMIGPISLKQVVVGSGEVKAISLMRRPRAAVAEGDSITRLTWQALLRTAGLSRPRARRADKPLQVRHIMRSNIKLLRASARLDEVLHFVEGSRYNHFPVIDDNGQFVGMIHFHDLRGIIYDPHMRDLVTAFDLASPVSPTVPVDLPLNELLEVFHQTDHGSLAVVESRGSRKVVGLVEQRDLLRVLHAPTRPT
jgi:Kef-type K+ transport system membrane component KefB/predicted transcriptional regulator